MMPITTPAAMALCVGTAKPSDSAKFRIVGPTVSSAKKPYTTVGIPARISMSGLTILRVVGWAYSAKYIATINPIGPATAMATSMIRNVPAKMGTAPKAPEDPA